MTTARQDPTFGACIGTWTWRTFDGLVTQHTVHPVGLDVECVGEAAAIHSALLGECNEIEQLFTGDITVIGTRDAVLDFLASLPLVAHAYRQSLLLDDHRLDVDVLRFVPIGRCLEGADGLERYGPASSDQIALAAALLVSLPPRCQSVQSANLASVLLSRPNLGHRAVELITELVRRGAASSIPDTVVNPERSKTDGALL